MDNSDKTIKLLVVRMPADLHFRLKCAGAHPTERHGMSGIVIRAVEQYLEAREHEEPSFAQQYIARTRFKLPPTLYEKAHCYGVRITFHDRDVRFLSQTLQQHFTQDLWNRQTHALVLREMRWRAGAGLPCPPRSILLPQDATEDDLPTAALQELPQWA